MSDQYNQGTEHGEYVQHPDMSREPLDKAVFFTSTANPTMRMIRPDGINIVFHNRIFKAEVEGDVDYLMDELKKGHKHFRLSTPEEIREYGLRTDPINTIRAEALNDEGLRAQMLAEAKKQLEAQLLSGELILDDQGNLINKTADVSGQGINLDPDPEQLAAGGDPIVKLKESAVNKLDALRGKLNAEQHPEELPAQKLNPVNTADLGKNIAG